MNNSRKIVDLIADSNAIKSKDEINKLLYTKAATTLDEKIKEEGSSMMKDIKDELSPEQEAFRKFFKEMLKKWEVESPNDLDDEDKKKFYNEIESGWKDHPDNEGE